MRSHRLHALAAACLVLAATSLASAEVSKEACVESHSRGQDARDQGKLSLARKLFLTCAQSACPSLVQGDCARFADDLTRTLPSLAFTARDGSGADLPDTSVYIDDVLTATRLDDGKPYDVDPGAHVVKFFHGSKEQSVTIVVQAGEKNRPVAVTFGARAPSTASANAMTSESTSSPRRRNVPTTTHPTGAKVLILTGTVLAVGGVGLGFVGMSRVPNNCSVSTHQCAAPPGDPSFDAASSAIKLSNLGWIGGGVGLAAVVGGMVWYFQGSTKTERSTQTAVSPWVTPGSAGVTAMGRF
jgi:hypothetical protein